MLIIGFLNFDSLNLFPLKFIFGEVISVPSFLPYFFFQFLYLNPARKSSLFCVSNINFDFLKVVKGT